MVTLGVRNLTKEFQKGVRSVDEVTFDVPAGQLFTLLGPSGCGKTTTLRMIAGLERPTSGQILFDNVDCTTLSPHRRGIGMVFQSYALFPHMTIFENVAYALRIRKTSASELKRRVLDSLDLVGLSGTADRKPSQMSGGQQQRVALARALVYEPSVLLLDEPLSNLDAKLRVYMREEIRKIQKRAGITALYVTHDQEEALSISDQVAVMHSGRISQLDRPYTVYENPESVLVADFIGRANFVDARLTEVSDRVNRVRVGESHLTLAATANRHGLKANAEAVLFFRPERATLTAEAPADNYLPVTVRHLLYLGETVRYFVMLGEVELVISQNRRVDGLEVGGQGYLELGPEDARLFPAEQKRLLKGGN